MSRIPFQVRDGDSWACGVALCGVCFLWRCAHVAIPHHGMILPAVVQ